MIKHVVLFQFKKTLTEMQIASVMEGFTALRKQIPQILSYQWGANNSPEGLDKGFRHGFVMELAGPAQRKAYLEHPAHVKFANETIFPALEHGKESVVVFDYDV